MGCPSPDNVCEPFGLWQSLASGKAPPAILPHLCGATLLAIRKKSGVSIGEVLRWLTSKCFSSISRSTALLALAPLQLGVGVKGGCDAIIHAISSLMSSGNPAPHWTLLLDFSNAFNNISREAMFKQIRRHVPSLSAWMESCYSSQALLRLGQDTVLSCCGVQQGDPLGLLDFTLSLHPIVEHIR